MQRHGILHLFLFAFFFSVGAVALGGAVLCDSLIQYYRNQHYLSEAERSLERLESLNAEYDALLERLESDPNLYRRLAPVALGTEPEDPNAIYPKARARELALARKALAARTQDEPNEPATPLWLQRCSEPRRKMALFIAGAGLVLVSLVFFSPRSTTEKSQP